MPFVRPLPGALPPPARPLELTAGQAPERTWHLPPPPDPEAATVQEPEPESLAAASGSEESRRELSWEVEAMTTPEYTAPHSIHDPEHDSWPVAAPDGSAAPAWEDGDDAAQLELTDVVDAESEPIELTEVVVAADTEADVAPLELELSDVVDAAGTDPDAEPAPAARGEDEEAGAAPYVDATRDPDTTFPLDAFIVPSGVEHVPAGYLDEIAGSVADRLEALARQIRAHGIQSVGKTDGADELAHVLGALVTGYLARRD